MSDYLTVQQAAEKLGVSTKTVRRWETEGKIESLRTSGGHRRFKLKTIDPEANKLSKKTIFYIVSSAVSAGLVTYWLTKSHYQSQLSTLTHQVNTLVNVAINDNQLNNASSGVGNISLDDNQEIFIPTSKVSANSNITLTPTNQESKLSVKQILSGLGFIVTTDQQVLEPLYFNWSISQ